MGEWARAVFTEAKRHALTTAVISDGNTTEDAWRTCGQSRTCTGLT